MKKPASTNPWDWLQPHDFARMGDIIRDPQEQTRWCRAVMLGGLPFMWHRASVVKDLVYDKLDLRDGDKVLVIGESVESCGFIDDIRARIGARGDIRVIDITDEARDAYFSGKRGRGGQLATWAWNYTSGIADAQYDCVTVLQAVQHTDDWTETGAELLRIMKPGRTIALAEITFGPEFQMLSKLDMHLEYILEKLFSRVGFRVEDFPYYSPEDLRQAFTGLVRNPGTFLWKGIEVFWGAKP
jgi:hypothetical protein